jgi:D-xylonolactonase
MFETLASGYGLIEGPREDPAGGLYFSDVTRGGVYRRAPDGAINTVVPKRRGVGGIALHRDGGIVISGKNVCHVRDGETRIVLEVEGVGGFNDLFTDARGRVYVGSLRSDPFAEGDRTPGELYRVSGGGKVEELYGDVGITNGIGFSPSGDRIYHSDSAVPAILVHDVDAQGALSGRRHFAVLERGIPDGLAVDVEGCVWVAVYGAGAALRFRADGSLDRALEVPAEAVTSLCFGGADRRDLIVVTADNREDPSREGTVFRTRVDVPGLPAPAATV